jgi:hypothetical protein
MGEGDGSDGSDGSGYGGWGTQGVGSGFTGGNYGLGSGTESGNGFSVGNSQVGNLGNLGSTNYGFGGMGTSPGLNAGGYALGGNLGNNLGSLYGGDYAAISQMPTDFSLASMYADPTKQTLAGNPNEGFTGQGMEGLRAMTTADPSMGYALSRGVGGQGLTGNENGETPGFLNSPAWGLISKALNIAPQTRPLGMAMGLAQGLSSNPAQTIASRVNPMAGTIYGGLASGDPTRAAANYGARTVGSTIGGAVAGAAGAAIGNEAGGWAANTAMNQANAEKQGIGAFGNASPAAAGFASGALGSGPNTPGNGGGGTNWDALGNMAGLAGQLYGGYRSMGSSNGAVANANATQQALQGQMSSLANMYGPDSPYAKQLSQELARRDAKAGRNSQYGPRSVELQAKLAAMAPTVANSMAGLGKAASDANTQGMAANQNQNVNYGQILGMLGNKDNRAALSSGWDSLKGLFSSDNTPSWG